MCCHYTTAAKNIIETSLIVYSAFPTIAIYIIGLHVLNAILPRSGDKWRRYKRKPAAIITMARVKDLNQLLSPASIWPPVKRNAAVLPMTLNRIITNSQPATVIINWQLLCRLHQSKPLSPFCIICILRQWQCQLLANPLVKFAESWFLNWSSKRPAFQTEQSAS